MRSRPAAALLIAAVVALAGCGRGGATSTDTTGDTSAPDAPGEVTAFASVFALSWIGQEIAPDASFTALGAGGDPHDVDLSSAQREAVGGSDVVLYLGDIEFQPQVEEAVADSEARVVAVSEVVGEDALLEGEEEDEHAEEGGEDADGSETEAAAGEEEEHADEAGVVDPHLWFDPALMAEVAQATGEAFAEADPGGAEDYLANAERVATELTDLDGEIDDLFADCERDEAVVSHEAYAYLLGPRDKAQVGIAGLAPEANASSAQIAALVEEVEAQGITTVLAEPEEGRADAETLAEETGIDLVEISPLESVDDDQFAEGYPTLLRQQADAFATAFGCS